MICWFIGFSAIVVLVGWKLSPKTKDESEDDVYYEQVRKDCVAYAEDLYCKK